MLVWVLDCKNTCGNACRNTFQERFPLVFSPCNLPVLYECIILGRKKIRIADVLPLLFPYFVIFLLFSGKRVLLYAILITVAFKRVVWWHLSRFLTDLLATLALHVVFVHVCIPRWKRKEQRSRAFALWMRG